MAQVPPDESHDAEETRALWQLARDAPVIRQLVDAAPAILAMVQQQKDRGTFRRELRRITRWDDGVGSAVKAFMVAAIGALTLYAAANLFSRQPPSLPPSVPPVSTPMPTPTPSPTPSPRATP